MLRPTTKTSHGDDESDNDDDEDVNADTDDDADNGDWCFIACQSVQFHQGNDDDDDDDDDGAGDNANVDTDAAVCDHNGDYSSNKTTTHIGHLFDLMKMINSK